MKSKHFVILVLLVVMNALTSCGIFFKKKEEQLNIYQPIILSLEKDIPIKTKEGVYTPQTDEVWHSDKRYRELEREILYK